MIHWTVPLVMEMVTGLDTLHAQLAGYWNEYPPTPLPGSQAAAESDAASSSELLHAAFDQANILLEVCADEVTAVCKTLTPRAECFAPWTCSRALIEASTLASWLLKPSLNGTERVKRSLALRFDGLTEQAKFASLKGDKSASHQVHAQINNLEGKALARGFPKLEKKGKRTGIGMCMPCMTDLVRDELGAEDAYRLMSAVLHAHFWAVKSVGFRMINDDGTQPTDKRFDIGAHVMLEKYLEPTFVAYLCINTIDSIARPMQYKAKLFGWDLTQLSTILSYVYALAGKPTPLFC